MSDFDPKSLADRFKSMRAPGQPGGAGEKTADQLLDQLTTSLTNPSASDAPDREAMLRAMSNEELIAYEDELLLHHETESQSNVRVSSGRLIVFVLSGIFITLFMALFSAFMGSHSRQGGNPLLILVWLILFGLGVFCGHFTWKFSTAPVRRWVRLALHYWPVTIAVAVTIATQFKK